MKFMKLGSKPDSFYTEEATRYMAHCTSNVNSSSEKRFKGFRFQSHRSVSSDVPSDLVIQIKTTKYLLHKFPLLPKCGLLQRLCVGSDDAGEESISLHDIPGGEDAFELCAKFCYGITISLSANNLVPALCAAKFLRMTESVEKGNFVQKLEAFFTSCILEGWKDSIVTLQTTTKLPEWSETLGIVRRCIDSLVEKILTHPSKVNWSYTYTRPGYSDKRHHSVPKDWWTEDIATLDIDLFRFVIAAVRSLNVLPSPLIGEALHVYAYRWLPDTSTARPPESSAHQTEENVETQKKALEIIVSMIPLEHGSVSFGFLLRLLSIANFLGVSHSTKADLLRRSSWQLDEAKINDLLIPSCSTLDQYFYDIDLVQAVLENFLVQWRRQASLVSSESRKSLKRVAKLIDSYLQVVAKDPKMPASKIVTLAETLPDVSRPEHDDLYKAINNYLKEHQDLSKAEKKKLCRILDCEKLSQEVCRHAIKNERLPLRTVVQVLYYDQERRARTTSNNLIPHSGIIKERDHTEPVSTTEGQGYQGTERNLSSGAEKVLRGSMPASERIIGKPDDSLASKPERKVVKKEVTDTEIVEEGTFDSKLEKKKVLARKAKAEPSHSKGHS